MNIELLQNELAIARQHYRDNIAAILAKHVDMIVDETRMNESATPAPTPLPVKPARERKAGGAKKARATNAELADLESAVLFFADDNDGFSKGGAAKAIRRQAVEVGTALRRLVKAGKLIATGNRGSTRYSLASRQAKPNGVAAEASAS